jgi:Site-specific recombinase XerD
MSLQAAYLSPVFERRIVMGKRGNGEGSIYKRLDGKWCAQYYLEKNGKKIRRSVYANTRKEVNEKLQLKLKEVSQNNIVDNSKILLENWMLQWLEDYKKNQLKITTYQNYFLNYETHIKESSIGSITLDKLTTSDLQRYYNTKLAAGRSDGKGALSIRTVRYIYILINGALEQACRNGMLLSNVNKNTVLPSKKKMEFIPLTVEEVQRFLAVAKEERLYALYLLETFTGMRKGEILGLKWEDIDMEEKRLRIHHNLCIVNNDELGEGQPKTKLILQDPKTEKSKRTLPLNDMIILELKKHKKRQSLEKMEYRDIYEDKGMVFTRLNGNYINPRELLRDFQELLEKAGIEKKRFHDMRHTFASILLNENENPKVIQELLGHSNISTTMDVYSHVLDETKVKTLDKLFQKVEVM